MQPGPERQRPAVQRLVAVIAQSQIVVTRAAEAPLLPVGFDATDVAILDWIAAEGRRLASGLTRM